MSTATPVRIAQVALTNVLTTLLATAAVKTMIKEILLNNTSAAAVPVTLFAGPTGAGVAETIFPTTLVPANGQAIVTLSTVLNATDVIKGGAGTDAVIGCSISGVTIQ